MTNESGAVAMQLLFNLALLSFCSLALGQETAETPLDEIVVSATRLDASARDVARSISVVGKDRIQLAAQQLGLDEALAGVPGLYMQNRYNFAQDLRISLRGFGARASFGIRGIKVFVDDIPETLPDGQTAVDSIDIGSAKTIEVLRGPASSLYGNASGGVIAISSELGSPNPSIEGRIAAGKHGYRQYQLKFAGEFGPADYLLNVSNTELTGYREHSKARSSLLNSRVRFALSGEDSLTLSLNYTDQPEADDPGAIHAAQAARAPRSARDRNVQFDAGESLSQLRLGAVYRQFRDSGQLMLRSYYVWRDFSNRLPFVSGGSVALDRFFYGVGAQYTIGESLPEKFHLTVGIDLERQADERRRFDNNGGTLGILVFDQNEWVASSGLFLQGRYELNDTWSLLAGLRYDIISYDVSDRLLENGDDSGELQFEMVSPSLAVNFRTGTGVLFASYSSSFETPTTTELANPDGSGGFNSTLDPQTADNVEFGFKQAIGNMYYEIAVFTIDLEHELIPFELATSAGRTFYSNAGSSGRGGVEMALSWKHESGVRVDASYTWSDFKIDRFVDENGGDFSGKRLPGLQMQFGYLGLNYDSQNGFSATIEAFYSGELFANNANTAEVPAYTVINLRLSRDFENGKWRIRPYIGFNNMLDEKYNSNIRINAFGARFFEPAPERNIFAGIVINYQRDKPRKLERLK